GNDYYIVDNVGDTVTELSGEGTDTVQSSVSFTLSDHVDRLLLSGAGNINGAGNAQDNLIWGNGGANTLDGGLGADTLTGGAGADTFAFTTTLGGGNVDAIADFSIADDTILLSNAVFTGLSAGALAAGAFVIGSAAADADDRIIYDSAAGQLFFDADGDGAGAAILFATLAPGLALTSADFIVGGG
ncbi:MAG: calcium-binding protein, partial [Terricaulis sp.]